MNNYFGQIPTIMSHDPRVSDFGCRLYAELSSLANKIGYCFASNAFLAETFSKTPNHISKELAALSDLGYVRIEIESGYKRKLYPVKDLMHMIPLIENHKGANQKSLGGSSKMIRGVIKKNIHNKKIEVDNQIKSIESVEFVHEPAPFVSENDNLGSIPGTPPIPPVPPAPLPQSKPKKAAFIPPTLEEVKAAFVEVLKKKGSPHAEAWAESEAANFLTYWENAKFKPGKSGNWVLSLRVNTWVGNLNGRIQKAPFGVVLKPQGPRLPDAPTQPTKPQPAAPKGLGLDLEAFKNRINR